MGSILGHLELSLQSLGRWLMERGPVDCCGFVAKALWEVPIMREESSEGPQMEMAASREL